MSAAMAIENFIISPESTSRPHKHGRPGVADGYPARETIGQLRGGPAGPGERTRGWLTIDVTAGLESASIAVNARLADLCSASGRLFCRDALGTAEVRRAYLNVGFLRDRVAVQRKRGGQTASAPVGLVEDRVEKPHPRSLVRRTPGPRPTPPPARR